MNSLTGKKRKRLFLHNLSILIFNILFHISTLQFNRFFAMNSLIIITDQKHCIPTALGIIRGICDRKQMSVISVHTIRETHLSDTGNAVNRNYND